MTYEEHRTQQRLEAADRLEELVITAKQMVIDLRANPAPDTAGREAWLRSNDMAYARLYWLRREIGYVVNQLGVGLPPNWTIRQVTKEYTSEKVE